MAFLAAAGGSTASRIGQQETGSAAAQPTAGTDEEVRVSPQENEEAAG
ncbi:hypothetical protein ABZX77_15410 [Streptomyces sp. NPDC004237]